MGARPFDAAIAQNDASNARNEMCDAGSLRPGRPAEKSKRPRSIYAAAVN
jgi:hypothetical protein